MYYLNSAMMKAFGSLVNRQELPKELNAVLSDGFLDEADLTFFRVFEQSLKSADQSSFIDKTGIECFINHVHIDDYVDDDLFQYGCLFFQKLVDLLKGSYPDRAYLVILALDELSCSVRFHQKRDGESWLSDDLEKYQDEALLIALST